MNRNSLIAVLLFFAFVVGYQCGMRKGENKANDALDRVVSAHVERDRALNQLRTSATLHSASTPRHYLPKMEALPSTEGVWIISPSTEWILLYKDAEEATYARSDGLMLVKPLASLIRANMDGAQFYFYCYPDSTEPILIPQREP